MTNCRNSKVIERKQARAVLNDTVREFLDLSWAPKGWGETGACTKAACGNESIVGCLGSWRQHGRTPAASQCSVRSVADQHRERKPFEQSQNPRNEEQIAEKSTNVET
eukprot:3349191-Amphidinium_carterae.1